jgi:3-hydroxy-9,10-secoandrosta-1,3,5(10)-triene-9,17-dione monooxygenase reductase component
MTCQSFSSVSLSPPLVLFCPAKASGTWPTIERAGFFCVNVLADGQQEISTRMATTGVARFDGIPWSQSGTGAPLLDGILGYVDCTIHTVHEAGDHHVVIGRVEDLGIGDAERPLLFFRGEYTGTR